MGNRGMEWVEYGVSGDWDKGNMGNQCGNEGNSENQGGNGGGNVGNQGGNVRISLGMRGMQKIKEMRKMELGCSKSG